MNALTITFNVLFAFGALVLFYGLYCEMFGMIKSWLLRIRDALRGTVRQHQRA